MKYKTSTSGINFVLLLLIATIWLSGCADDNAVTIQEAGNTVNFTVTVPDVLIPSVSTRTMVGAGGANKEDEVKSVDILVFDASVSPEVFLERVEGTSIAQDLANNNSTVTFSAKLSRTNASTRIVVVANKSLSSFSFTPGETTKLEVMEALINSSTDPSTDKWPADGSKASGYIPIPMYGEAEVSKIYSQMPSITNISMTRMLARIDILNNADNFTVEEVYLTNYNRAGYIAPAWDSSNGNIDGTIYEPMIPDNSGTTNVIDYAVNIANGGSYKGEIYTYEALAAVDGTDDTDSSRKDAVCLIVKGRIGSGASSYYRIDFMDMSRMVYIPLKRNYKYEVDIQKASGAGYASITEAIEGYRTMTNLDVRLIAIDRNKITSIVYNGQYMLGVSEDKVIMRQYENANYKITVFTDSPGGWKAEIPSGSWLTFNDGTNMATGISNQENTFSLRIPYYRASIGSVRKETITLTAGRLTHQVTVEQSVQEPGMIRFMDAYGNLLDNGLFFPMEDATTGNDPEAQSIYVMWTTGEVETWLQPRDEYGEGIPVEYVSFTPSIPDGKFGRAPLYNGIQAITVQPRKGDDDWRWDIIYFDLYDDDRQWIGTEIFPINQGLLTFKFYNLSPVGNYETYALELGPVHTLDLGANVNWEITKVEEIGNTGLLGMTDQDIRVGTSNRIDKTNIITNWNTALGTDLVAQEGRFYLNFPTGDWVPGKTGTVRVTFRNQMHTKGVNKVRDDTNLYERGPGSDDDYFPFYRTIDLILTGPIQLSYATPATGSYFYVNKEEYFNDDASAAYMSLETAQNRCAKLGPGWRIPSMNELMLSYIYVDATGGSGAGIPGKWFNNNSYRYWSSTPSSGENYWGFQFSEPVSRYESTLSSDDNYQATLRCVRDQSSGQYPYLTPNYTSDGITGALIVSRDNNGGVDPSAILSTNGALPGTDNRVAPKLLVENTNTVPGVDYDKRNWNAAQKTCTDKGEGWRLPTLREVQLIWLLGGTTETTLGGYKDMSWGGDFQKIDLIPPSSNTNGMTWTVTENSSGEVYAVNIFDFYRSTTNEGYYLATVAKDNVGALPWATVRCVKSID